ncbi:hypothetical protein ABBQ38_004967 [Trebouxia sp. C0009 RCD-2024]
MLDHPAPPEVNDFQDVIERADAVLSVAPYPVGSPLERMNQVNIDTFESETAGCGQRG